MLQLHARAREKGLLFRPDRGALAIGGAVTGLQGGPFLNAVAASLISENVAEIEAAADAVSAAQNPPIPNRRIRSTQLAQTIRLPRAVTAIAWQD